MLAVDLRSLALPIRPVLPTGERSLIGNQPQPLERILDVAPGALHVAFQVRVLETEDEGTALLARV
jgi:hypothetical protein